MIPEYPMTTFWISLFICCVLVAWLTRRITLRRKRRRFSRYLKSVYTPEVLRSLFFRKSVILDAIQEFKPDDRLPEVEIKCGFGCNSDASVHVCWSGASGRVQNANACSDHAKELQSKMDGLLDAGIGMLSFGPPTM